MLKGNIRNIVIAVGLANLVFCIWFVFAHINADAPIPSDIPQTKSEIPFIPEEEKNDVAEVIIKEDINPVILEGKTKNEIEKTLNEESVKVAKFDNLPSLVDVIKNEKVLSCNSFVKIKEVTDQDELYRLEDC